MFELLIGDVERFDFCLVLVFHYGEVFVGEDSGDNFVCFFEHVKCYFLNVPFDCVHFVLRL